MFNFIKESVDSFKCGYILNRLDNNSLCYGIKGGIKQLYKDIKECIKSYANRNSDIS